MSSKKKNAFYIFMNQRKPELERKLKRKITMAELPGLLSHEWQMLPEQDRKNYKDNKNISVCNEKYDSRGLPLSELEQQKEDVKMGKIEMKKEIKRTIDLLNFGKALCNESFFVVSMSYYVQLVDWTYLPAEISICQFSFAKGLLSHYHRIFPACIPLGYKYEAMQHSERTHNLIMNLMDNSEGFERELFQYLFKEGGSKLPTLYTPNENLEEVRSMLKDCNFKTPIKIYSLDYLLQQMYSTSILDIPEAIASEMLLSSRFDFVPSLACSWHQKRAPDAINFCTSNSARRWIFNTCKAMRLEDTFGVLTVKGKHLPEDLPYTAVCELFQGINLNCKPSEAASNAPAETSLTNTFRQAGNREGVPRPLGVRGLQDGYSLAPPVNGVLSRRPGKPTPLLEAGVECEQEEKRLNSLRDGFGFVGYGRGKRTLALAESRKVSS